MAALSDEDAGQAADSAASHGDAEPGHQGQDAPEKPGGAEPAGSADATKDKSSDEFGNAAKNPSGRESWGRAEAFRRGRRNLRIGDGVAVSDSRVRDVVVDASVTNVLQATAVQVKLGRVRDEVLAQIRARYVDVDGYEDLLRRLDDRHLVLLRGADRTGRTTTALRLLDAVSGGNVSRLDPADIHRLEAEHIEKGRGYLTELSPQAVAAFTEMHLDRLSALLADGPGWCVIAVGLEFVPDGRLTSYVVECRAPDGASVLERHLAFATRDADAHALPSLLAIADLPDVKAALGPAPGPAEMAALANLLLAHRRGELSVPELAASCKELVDRAVMDWFQGSHEPERGDHGDRALRLAGFRIALAAFHQSPPHVVAKLGELLAEHLIRARNPHRKPGRPAFTAEHRAWLEVSRAHLTPGVVWVGDAAIPADFAEFRDARMPVILLTRVWQHHHNVREPILAWLRELTDDPDPEVWVRAAQVVGLLCALDFPYVYHALIDELAKAPERHQRFVAALALDQAARAPNVRAAVLELLRKWRHSAEEPRMWTAAAALGMDLGLGRVESSLNELCGLGVWHDDDKGRPAPLQYIVGYSIAQLLSLGAVEPVVSRLRGWLEAPRKSVQNVALLAILYAADLKVADLWNIDVFGSPTARDKWLQLADRRLWPFLLALQVDDPRLAEPLADLVWQAVDIARYRHAALAVLGRWMRAGSRDPACLQAVAAFLMMLADTPRSAGRLRDLVNRLRNRMDRPLRADVADYLIQSLSIAGTE